MALLRPSSAFPGPGSMTALTKPTLEASAVTTGFAGVVASTCIGEKGGWSGRAEKVDKLVRRDSKGAAAARSADGDGCVTEELGESGPGGMFGTCGAGFRLVSPLVVVVIVLPAASAGLHSDDSFR